MTKQPELSLRKLIRRAGGTNRVARELGVSSGAVSQWIAAGCLPLTEVQEKTHYAKRLLEMSGAEAEEWDVRLIGRR
ncbi:hypothetical protein SAMN05661010_02545 [Modicisalibacter muralis]|uniref:Antitoxin of toxin-antitoxin system, YdaS/YdaT n=1 Tax=Modicisalibacter muralis TaxID=119000 RepID=A0A1G9MW64_9GAMM|nr:hypothetical protein SAMN05661010_02545 [Halomonas muralis]